jgi:hypothetical protein
MGTCQPGVAHPVAVMPHPFAARSSAKESTASVAALHRTPGGEFRSLSFAGEQWEPDHGLNWASGQNADRR